MEDWLINRFTHWTDPIFDHRERIWR